MSRIQKAFERLNGEGRKALIPFITAGDPSADLTVPLMHALVWFLVGGAGHQHRADHQGEVVVQGADESVQLGDEQEAINPAGPDGQFVQPGGVAQSGGQHLVAEVECFALGVLGMRQSGLQDCQIEFESVIGPECRFDPHRHQQTLLTQ